MNLDRLDALLAEHAMGAKHIGVEWSFQLLDALPPDSLVIVKGVAWCNPGGRWRTWQPTRDANDRDEAVAAIAPRLAAVRQEAPCNGLYLCECLDERYTYFWHEADTPGEAFAKAALAALGVNY